MNDSPLDQFDLRLARPDELDLLVQLDDEAGVIFERMGMTFSFPVDHPFVVAERTRWRAALGCERGRVIALPQGDLAAFAIFGEVDGLASLEQLSVRPQVQRRGLGRALVAECIRWANGRDVWLTTYAHVPWNAPYYRRLGFHEVPPSLTPPGLQEILRTQRAALPEPEQRIAMVRPSAVDWSRPQT
jgi:GNAT superfamily N-acetyltransferase